MDMIIGNSFYVMSHVCDVVWEWTCLMLRPFNGLSTAQKENTPRR